MSVVTGAGADATRRPHWVELRIHGVSGTPPESMLESAHVVQVAGNAWGRFFRPADALGNEVQDDPDRTLEGYHWGKYTSGSSLKGLWLILIPFGLVNAAAFMIPDPGPDRTQPAAPRGGARSDPRARRRAHLHLRAVRRADPGRPGRLLVGLGGAAGSEPSACTGPWPGGCSSPPS